MKLKAMKFGIVGLSALSLMLSPLNIFAQEKESLDTINLIPKYSDQVRPLYDDTNRVTIQNGETAYFVNKGNGQPFTLVGGCKYYYRFSMEKTSMGVFEYGLVDENNNIIFESSVEGSQIGVGRTVTIPQSGKYKLYFTNYSMDPVFITSVSMDMLQN